MRTDANDTVEVKRAFSGELSASLATDVANGLLG
jgi:hypothetical protein